MGMEKIAVILHTRTLHILLLYSRMEIYILFYFIYEVELLHYLMTSRIISLGSDYKWLFFLLFISLGL